ncbi:MAG: hypothetical protein MZU91_15255 [Desulfosudis oleivorans]|nr:hypothetical protein [Desulfosudis oleivorans]
MDEEHPPCIIPGKGPADLAVEAARRDIDFDRAGNCAAVGGPAEPEGIQVTVAGDGRGVKPDAGLARPRKPSPANSRPGWPIFTAIRQVTRGRSARMNWRWQRRIVDSSSRILSTRKPLILPGAASCSRSCYLHVGADLPVNPVPFPELVTPDR